MSRPGQGKHNVIAATVSEKEFYPKAPDPALREKIRIGKSKVL